MTDHPTGSADATPESHNSGAAVAPSRNQSHQLGNRNPLIGLSSESHQSGNATRLIGQTEPDETGTPLRRRRERHCPWQCGWRTGPRLDGSKRINAVFLYGRQLSYCVVERFSAYFPNPAAILTGSAGQSVAKRGSGAGREFRHRASRARPAASQSEGAVFRVPCRAVPAILTPSHAASMGTL